MGVTCILAWVIFACLLLGTVRGSYGGYGGYGGYKPPKIVLKQKYQGPSLKDQLRKLEERVAVAEKRGCDTGSLEPFFCPHDDEDSWCTHKYDDYSTNKVVNIPVKYHQYFHRIPVVTAGLSGAYFQYGRNFSTEVTDVKQDEFNIRITLGAGLPFQLRLFWAACDGKA